MMLDAEYKKIFIDKWFSVFRKKPSRHNIIAFMWGMSAGSDRRSKESELK